MSGSCDAAAPLKVPRGFQPLRAFPPPVLRYLRANFERLVVACTSPRSALSPTESGYANIAQVWYKPTRRKPSTASSPAEKSSKETGAAGRTRLWDERDSWPSASLAQPLAVQRRRAHRASHRSVTPSVEAARDFGGAASQQLSAIWLGRLTTERSRTERL